ncbi:MAG: bifunctional (p)ppGpp synthetase/guanosine-3',5'-bis(diphosphate) 3'-pyrophosphohydrolase [Clostridia bacterium]|nr:bifunctional (p)ppGpp synthetase/guanosine-3',5'-bis(diphosphate) 3'-pyrophosphohydrolase [Clostridia bacterium]
MIDKNRKDNLIENLTSKVKYYYPNDNLIIMQAFEMAKKAHEGQLRASGSPYITHPIQVADILIDLGMDYTAVCAGLLHDTVEDTAVTDEEIRQKFGDTVADLVAGVTKLAKFQFNTIEEEQVENIRKMFFAMAKDIRVLIIKLADRLHNMRSLSYLSPSRQLAMAKETMEVYAPLAGRLGISPVKCELEDLCLKYLDKPAYDYLAENIAQTKLQRQEQVDAVIAEIKKIIAEAEVENAEVSGRTKHFYSIYKKMKNQHKTLDQIYDMTAVRVIVDTVKDCFSVLGVIHARWKPIPGRFKDYIAVPKPNMYQSLHTTVITNYGVPFEIQIRTKEMHKVAEYGIAAHWKYKEGIKGSTSLDDKLRWVKEVLSYEPDIQDSKEFLDLIKRDISATSEIYVFTPKGDVVALSSNATALDFAYAIHSQVGNHCVGIKVNGKIVPLDRQLETGEVVEVLTNANSKGPSRDWLKIVRSSSAKAKIRQFFKRELKEEHLKLGKSLLEKDAKHRGLVLSSLLTTEGINAVCARYSFSSMDEAYASVGYGGITTSQVLSKLLGANNQTSKLADILPTQEIQLKKKPKNADNVVDIKGHDDLLVRFSACCSPVFGDDIIGYISRGRGVSIHRKDCYCVKSLEQERLVEAKWIQQESAKFHTAIQIVSENKVGVFAEITKVISNQKLPLLAVKAKIDKNGDAVSIITLEVSGQEEVEELISKIRSLSTTLKVFRVAK